MSTDDRISALEKLVADLATQVLLMSEVGGGGDFNDGYHQRRLDHNASLGSIYEFPQMAGGPIYIPQGTIYNPCRPSVHILLQYTFHSLTTHLPSTTHLPVKANNPFRSLHRDKNPYYQDREKKADPSIMLHMSLHPMVVSLPWVMSSIPVIPLGCCPLPH